MYLEIQVFSSFQRIMEKPHVLLVMSPLWQIQIASFQDPIFTKQFPFSVFAILPPNQNLSQNLKIDETKSLKRQTIDFKLYLKAVHACSVTSVMSNSLRPYGLSIAWLLCPWDSPGKNTGAGCMPSFRGSF